MLWEQLFSPTFLGDEQVSDEEDPPISQSKDCQLKDDFMASACMCGL